MLKDQAFMRLPTGFSECRQIALLQFSRLVIRVGNLLMDHSSNSLTTVGISDKYRKSYTLSHINFITAFISSAINHQQPIMFGTQVFHLFTCYPPLRFLGFRCIHVQLIRTLNSILPDDIGITVPTSTVRIPLKYRASSSSTVSVFPTEFTLMLPGT